LLQDGDIGVGVFPKGVKKSISDYFLFAD